MLRWQKCCARLRASQPRADHQRSTTNKICIGARNQSGVGGFPRSPTPLTAALTLAMKSPRRSAMRQIPASRRDCGSTSPAAPSSSNTPVTYTMSNGCGKYAGIIRAKSCFILLKCADAVKTNIKASAQRAESCQEARAGTPAAPMPRRIPHATSKTIRTSIANRCYTTTSDRTIPPCRASARRRRATAQ